MIICAFSVKDWRVAGISIASLKSVEVGAAHDRQLRPEVARSVVFGHHCRHPELESRLHLLVHHVVSPPMLHLLVKQHLTAAVIQLFGRARSPEAKQVRADPIAEADHLLAHHTLLVCIANVATLRLGADIQVRERVELLLIKHTVDQLSQIPWRCSEPSHITSRCR